MMIRMRSEKAHADFILDFRAELGIPLARTLQSRRHDTRNQVRISYRALLQIRRNLIQYHRLCPRRHRNAKGSPVDFVQKLDFSTGTVCGNSDGTCRHTRSEEMTDNGRQSAESTCLAANAGLISDDELEPVVGRGNLIDADPVRKHLCGMPEGRKAT